MSSAVSYNGNYMDSEYQTIIRALRAYGVEPTGDKSVDKAKLERIESSKSSAKAQSAKLENNFNQKTSQETQNKTDTANAGAGTDQIAMLNKLRFGLI